MRAPIWILILGSTVGTAPGRAADQDEASHGAIRYGKINPQDDEGEATVISRKLASDSQIKSNFCPPDSPNGAAVGNLDLAAFKSKVLELKQVAQASDSDKVPVSDADAKILEQIKAAHQAVSALNDTMNFRAGAGSIEGGLTTHNDDNVIDYGHRRDTVRPDLKPEVKKELSQRQSEVKQIFQRLLDLVSGAGVPKPSTDAETWSRPLHDLVKDPEFQKITQEDPNDPHALPLSAAKVQALEDTLEGLASSKESRRGRKSFLKDQLSQQVKSQFKDGVFSYLSDIGHGMSFNLSTGGNNFRVSVDSDAKHPLHVAAVHEDNRGETVVDEVLCP